MNNMAVTPVPGPASAPSVQPAAAVSAVAEIAANLVPNLPGSTLSRVKDALVTIYAYGLLAFGIFFPLLLAAWCAVFRPAAQ